jgi:hypothetical protein
MTKFEQIGINRLYLADTKTQLTRTFNHSCNCCCYRGVHLDCDRCAIAATHSMLVAIISDKEGEHDVDA